MGHWDDFFRTITRGLAAEALEGTADGDLVRRLLAGPDEAAYEALLRRHGPMVYRVCWRVLRNDPDAEDAFQATFLVLAQHLRSVRDHNSLASWLHGVARRVAMKAHSAAAARVRHERRAARPEAADPTSADVFQVLDTELAALPERWRLPLVLCYLEGRTQDEAAAHLGCGKNTLRRRLGEARAALARRLARRGVLPAAAVLLSECAADAAPSQSLVAETARTLAAGRASPVVAALAKGVMTTMVPYRVAIVLVVAVGAFALAAGGVPVGSSEPARVNLRVPEPSPPSEPAARPDEPPKVFQPRTLSGHTGTVRVAFSNDGKTLATFSDDTTVLLRDPNDGAVRHRLTGHLHPVSAAAFSPDGKTLATADFKTVRVWDVATGKPGEALPARFATVQGLAYAPDGKALAVVSDDGKIELWAGGKLTRSFASPKPDGVPVVVSSVRFSPDGTVLAVVTTDGHPGPGHVRLWDPAAGKVTRTVLEAGKDRQLWGAVFSPDGTLLAVGDGRGRVTVFATKDWKPVREFETEDQLRSLAFAPDSRSLAVGLRRDVQVWDAAEGKRQATLEGHGNWVLSLAYSPVGVLASGSSDRTARLWKP